MANEELRIHKEHNKPEQEQVSYVTRLIVSRYDRVVLNAVIIAKESNTWPGD